MNIKFYAAITIGLLIFTASGFKVAEIVPDYFPLRPGQTLTYREETTDDTKAIGKRTITFLPAEVSNGMGGVVFPVKEDSSGSVASLPHITTMYYKRTARGYMYNTSKESLDYLFLPEDIHLDKKWKIKNGAKYPCREVVAMDEEVVTPAGTFKCIKVSQEGTWEFWFAPGVGLVKVVNPRFVMALESVAMK